MMILKFEDSEEEILNHIISYVGTGARTFQVAEILYLLASSSGRVFSKEQILQGVCNICSLFVC